jgi:DNA-binding MarR family transcriptional regulator
MRYIRSQMRSHRYHRLSVPQFRALIFASIQEGPALSDLAEHLGLSLPATSRMVDQLVRQGLLERRQAASDRRCVSLSPTRRGRAAFQRAREATRAALAERFGAVSDQERVIVAKAMKILERAFATNGGQT